MKKAKHPARKRSSVGSKAQRTVVNVVYLLVFQTLPGKPPVMSSKARGILVSIVWLFVLQWIDYRGLFTGANGIIYDFILRTSSTASERAASTQIYLVEIDDEAYSQCFKSESPMNPQSVFNLVTTVADANPKAVGVDIRTEGSDYKELSKKLSEYASSIVWVSALKTRQPHQVTFQNWLIGDQDYDVVTPRPVLGFPPEDLVRSRQTNWGVPLYPEDEDGKVRRFPRTVRLSASDVQSGGTAPSWASRVAGVYCAPECKAESTDEIFISYHVSAPLCAKMLDLFTCSSDTNPPRIEKNMAHWPGFANNVLGKIVLIGGTFKESGDFYRTPATKQKLPGLVVNAYAVKSELNGNGFEALRQPLAWMLDLLLGLLIVFVCENEFTSRIPGWERKKIVVSTGIVVLFCLASFRYSHGRYLLGFAGEGAAVVIDRMRDLWKLSGQHSE